MGRYITTSSYSRHTLHQDRGRDERGTGRPAAGAAEASRIHLPDLVQPHKRPDGPQVPSSSPARPCDGPVLPSADTKGLDAQQALPGVQRRGCARGAETQGRGSTEEERQGSAEEGSRAAVDDEEEVEEAVSPDARTTLVALPVVTTSHSTTS